MYVGDSNLAIIKRRSTRDYDLHNIFEVRSCLYRSAQLIPAATNWFQATSIVPFLDGRHITALCHEFVQYSDEPFELKS